MAATIRGLRISNPHIWWLRKGNKTILEKGSLSSSEPSKGNTTGVPGRRLRRWWKLAEQANTSTGVGTEHSETFCVLSCICPCCKLVCFCFLVQVCKPKRVYCTSDLVETSADDSDEASSFGDSSQLNITDLLKHLMMQDQRRTEKELR